MFFFKKISDPRNFVTYLLTEIFLWNQMKAMILENVIIMSRLLRFFPVSLFNPIISHHLLQEIQIH